MHVLGASVDSVGAEKRHPQLNYGLGIHFAYVNASVVASNANFAVRQLGSKLLSLFFLNNPQEIVNAQRHVD